MSKSEFLQKNPQIELAKRLKAIAWIVSAVVLLLVGAMRQVKIPMPEGVEFSYLPPLHAILNTLVAVFLITAVITVKRGSIIWHQRMIYAAMICSILFLLSYVVYHFTTEETKFGGEGAIRVVYFILLISHIVLAALSLPFILLAWIYGFTNQFQKHRQLVKFVFPVWLYVAVTGPICYLMLRPYYA